MSFKRARTASFSQPTQPGYGYQLSSVGSAPSSRGRIIKGSYNAAKGTPKSYRVRAPPSLKRVVKAIIDQQKEQKQNVDYLYPTSYPGVNPLGATGLALPPNFQALAPVLSNGPQEGQRIGSDIRLTKSYVKFQLGLNQEASSSNGPFIVTVWIGKVRGLGAALPNSADFDNLLRTSTTNTYIAPSTTIPLTGLLPVNDDLWDIKVRKDYKLGKSETTNSTNNDYNLSYNDEIDITRMFPSVMRYSGADTTVEEDNLFFFATIRTLDGTLPTVGLPNICAMVMHRYTDA
jgi:hypothetical protein